MRCFADVAQTIARQISSATIVTARSPVVLPSITVALTALTQLCRADAEACGSVLTNSELQRHGSDVDTFTSMISLLTVTVAQWQLQGTNYVHLSKITAIHQALYSASTRLVMSLDIQRRIMQEKLVCQNVSCLVSRADAATRACFICCRLSMSVYRSPQMPSWMRNENDER